MKSRKKIFLIIVLISVCLFIALYFIYNYSEPNILSSKDKKWISENGKEMISIDVTNDIPLYSYDGEGIAFQFLDYVTEQSTIEFNKVPYLKDSEELTSDYTIFI